MTLLSPFGERSLTVVAASFPDRKEAELAASELLKETPDLRGEVALIRPGDPLIDRKLEPEDRGIWRTLIRSHVVFGLAGLLAGLSAALVAVAMPWPAAAASPAYTALFAGVFGAFFGMIGGGLLTLRPDHAYVIDKVHAFSSRGRWSVVVRPLSEIASKAAYRSLLQSGAGAVRSL